jgi:enterochelin esterase-like enzyme
MLRRAVAFGPARQNFPKPDFLLRHGSFVAYPRLRSQSLIPLILFLSRILMKPHIFAGLTALILASIARAQTPAALAAAPTGFDTTRDGIERGKTETVEYDSKSTGTKRKMVIYTPPGFSKEGGGAKYPVLYLLHGSGDDETGWMTKGSAHVVLDNLFADKKPMPMIVVMPNGFAARAGATQSTATPTRRDNSGFESDLLQDIIPFVESHYPVRANRENRALAGLSMGGNQSLTIGLKHLDTFAWVGGFSSAVRASLDSLIPDPAAAAKQLRLLWLSCGEKDRLMDANRTFHSALEEKKIPHVWHVESGAHEWPVWKNDLYLLTPMLFRDK